MVKKRPFGDEESYEGSSKHPRQLDYTNQLVSFLQFVRAGDTAQPPNVSGEVLVCFNESDEKHAGGITSELPIPTKKDSKIEEENGPESPFHLLLAPEHYNSDWHIRAIVSEETHGSLLAYPPQKLVPIGPDFQADVPEWGVQGANNACDSLGGSELFTLFPQALESNLSDNKNVENKLGGICIIAMPEFIPFADDDEDVGNGRTDCNCEDSGSVRCVRQHIQEARENLRSAFGQERFLELGFSDMGEVVAEKWSQEEELLFREMVFSNPLSSGYKFWDHLSMGFPFRSKRDIVSYYFNVFVLQKRSVQNRYNPMNIDSDDDEWLGIADSEDDDVLSYEGDGDSVFESKGCYGYNDSGEYEGSVPCEDFSNCKNLKFGCVEATVNNVIKGHLSSYVCTNGGDCNEYILEHCETKVWDVGCPTWPKNEVEFLPTCSMIEEVFGLGSLNSMPDDSKGLSYVG